MHHKTERARKFVTLHMNAGYVTFNNQRAIQQVPESSGKEMIDDGWTR